MTQILWAAKLADSVIAVKAKLVFCDMARAQTHIQFVGIACNSDSVKRHFNINVVPKDAV